MHHKYLTIQSDVYNLFYFFFFLPAPREKARALAAATSWMLMAMYAPDIANIVPMAIIIGSIRASLNSGGSMLITLSTKASRGDIVVVDDVVNIFVLTVVVVVVLVVVVILTEMSNI